MLNTIVKTDTPPPKIFGLTGDRLRNSPIITFEKSKKKIRGIKNC